MKNATFVCTTLLLLGVWLSTGAQEKSDCKCHCNQATAVKQTPYTHTALVVVGHGAPASDFPREKFQTLLRLERQIEQAGGEEKAPDTLVNQYHQIELECRLHPRTPQNDPYNAAVERIARAIAQTNRFDRVLIAHNEFCGLDVDEAIEQAIKQGATRVIVVTTMLVGGVHSERDIPQKIARAQAKFPKVQIQYIWPISPQSIANLMLQEIERHTGTPTASQ